MPLAVGAALSAKYRGTSQVVVSFFGDGASNQGTFHESMNMAALWKLPVIFVCENNFYAMSTPLCASTAQGDIAKRGGAYGIPSLKIDGNDVFTVKDAVKNAVKAARNGAGPSLIEMVTYRHKGHSKSDQCLYRSKEEESGWLVKCPIKNIEKVFTEKSFLSKADSEKINDEVRGSIKNAIEFATDSKEPSLRGI
jgi:pyruvate dehydrogenase E1 component alpha subunit